MQRKSVIVKRICSCLCTVALAFSLTACSSAGADDENVIIVEREEEKLVYNLTVASVGDVVKTERIKCTYQQMKDQDVSFELNGRLVTAVYVKEGDMVKKGQLLAELGSEDILNQIETLEYQIARNKMLLENSQVNETNNISLQWANYLYYGMGSESSVKAQVESIQQSGRYYREDLQDKIGFDEQQLESLKQTVKQSSVYANMEGTVSFVKERLEGSTSEKDEVVISIIDNTDCLFVVEEVEYADSFGAEDLLDMTVISGTGTGAYVLKPANMDKWNEKLLFSIVEQPEGVSPEVGAMGYMAIVVDRAENVVYLPLEAVHTAEDKHYVYVLDDDGNRQLLWVETGLQGDTSVEIVSGLSEGDKVILR
ncbi:MAG: biotin/lipoyl-binding protein [Lachnospiraceae bacterium]|nr:biotin/lipoyl-binding protein [Lachnospiraceae bacterium]